MKLIAMMVLGLFLLGGCIISKSSKDCANPTLTGDERDTCYHILARTKNDPASCAQINDMALRNNCYLEVAENVGGTNGLAICEYITKGQVTGDTELCAACKKAIDPSLTVNLADCTTS